MKRFVTLAIVAALAVGLVGPADAKKKKKKPAAVDLRFFMRWDEGCEAPFLSLTDGEEPSDCFYGVNDMFNEYPQAAAVSGDPVDSYVTSDGVPLVLDVSRKVTGSFTVRGWNGLGVGNAEVDVTLVATIRGEEKEIGTYNHAYFAGPDHHEEVSYEMPLDPALAGAEVEAVTLKIFTHGNVVAGRGVEHDSEVPPSVVIPALR